MAESLARLRPTGTGMAEMHQPAATFRSGDYHERPHRTPARVSRTAEHLDFTEHKIACNALKES